MNHKIFITYCLFVCLTLLISSQFVQARNNVSVIDKFIANQAKREKAEEYTEARKIIRGDLNNDGKEEFAVLYTLEGFGGGNLFLQYLAIFTNQGGNLKYVAQQIVGGKDRRILMFKSISKSQINFDTKEYLSKDASCCPSGKGKARFSFSNGKLTEMRKRAVK